MADPKQENSGAAASSGVLKEGANRLRESAKWLVVSFGGVAAVALAGVGFSKIGELTFETPDYRLLVAIVGSILAAIGILTALGVAMSLAAAGTVTPRAMREKPKWYQFSLSMAREEVQNDPSLRPWDRNFSAFNEAYELAYKKWQTELRLWANDRGRDPDVARVNRAARQVNELQSVMTVLLDSASFVRLQNSFRIARVVIAFALLVAAIGAVSVAWAANPDGAELSKLSSAPVAALLSVDQEQRKGIAADLGEDCAYDLNGLPVIIVAQDSEKKTAEVVTDPSSGCRALRRTVPLERLTVASLTAAGP